MSATNGGTIQCSQLTTINAVNITLDATGVMDTGQITSYTGGGTLTVSGGQGSVYVGAVPLRVQRHHPRPERNVAFGGNVQIDAASLVNYGDLTLDGTLNVSGSCTQAAGTALVVQIGGTQAGQFGSLALTAAATLAGALDVDLTGGVQPGQIAGLAVLYAASVAVQRRLERHTGGVPIPSAQSISSTAVSVVPALVADIAASAVSAPATASPGQQITVSWTVGNVGDATAAGPWTEQVLLAERCVGHE